MDYIRTMLTKLFVQQNDVTIYANLIALPTLEKLRNEFPSLNFDTRPNLHSNMVLVEDNIVWISSQNFGTSTWFENTLNISLIKTKYFLDFCISNHVGDWKIYQSFLEHNLINSKIAEFIWDSASTLNICDII